MTQTLTSQPSEPNMTEPAAQQPPTIVPNPEPTCVVLPFARGERERPETRRKSEIVRIEISGVVCNITAGFYADGRLCEAFVDTGKAGSGIKGWASTVSVLASLLIQHGASVEEIAEAIRYTSFEPSGPVYGAPLGFDDAKSFVDAFAQFLLFYRDGIPDEAG